METADIPRYLERIRDSQSALDAALVELTDAHVPHPSRLPGWTRGHVLTHIARNAETLAAMLDGARRGETVPQYGGSQDKRNADIEAGAGRAAAELAADVNRTSAEFLRAASAMTAQAWERRLVWLTGARPAPFALGSRWREVEVHHVDLNLGYRPADWPAEFVRINLERELRRLGERAPGVEPPGGLADAEVLAWLFGRPSRPGLPALPPWG